MMRDSAVSYNLINDNALTARAYILHQNADIRAFNSFYRQTSSYIEEKYRIASTDGWSDDSHPYKIWWREKIDGEMVTSDSISVGDFICKSLEMWDPDKGMSYTGWVDYLLEKCHHRVPATKDIRKLYRKYRDMYARYAKLKSENPKLTFAYFIQELSPSLSFEKKSELMMTYNDEKSFDDPVSSSDDSDDERTFGDVAEVKEEEDYEGEEGRLLEEIEKYDEIIRKRVKTRKSQPKVALFSTVSLIRKHIRYLDFSYYRNLIGEHECISDRIDELEEFYEKRRAEGKTEDKDLFPNQKEQAEMLGITSAAYNLLLHSLKDDSDRT